MGGNEHQETRVIHQLKTPTKVNTATNSGKEREEEGSGGESLWISSKSNYAEGPPDTRINLRVAQLHTFGGGGGGGGGARTWPAASPVVGWTRLGGRPGSRRGRGHCVPHPPLPHRPPRPGARRTPKSPSRFWQVRVPSPPPALQPSYFPLLLFLPSLRSFFRAWQSVPWESSGFGGDSPGSRQPVQLQNPRWG